jgi:hypothetical protein
LRDRPPARGRARLRVAAWLSLLTGLASPLGGAPPAEVAGAVAPPAEAELALRSLAHHVVDGSDPRGLEIALEAYYRYRSERPVVVQKPYLYYVDLGLDARSPRGYVFDMERLELIEGPFTVAHGSGSSATRDAVPMVFSNVPGSHASSLGLYLTRETYTFRGRSVGRAYQSVGLRLRGESVGFNDAAEERGIVVHGAPYVTPSWAGRSEGCPAMEPERAERLLPLLAGGAVVFIFSPHDERWLTHGPWARAE